MNIELFIKARQATTIQKVSCGYLTVTLFSPEELDDAQIGYRASETGEDLTGINEGDWNPNWLVIGHEDRCGDPIFVDVSRSTLPVFTAAHGQDRWDPELLAFSFSGFVLALNEVDRVCVNRRNPVELKRNPLSPGERETLLRQIAAMTETSNHEFWASWIQS